MNRPYTKIKNRRMDPVVLSSAQHILICNTGRKEVNFKIQNKHHSQRWITLGSFIATIIYWEMVVVLVYLVEDRCFNRSVPCENV